MWCVWDHPRSRGVYHGNDAILAPAEGSSPLARGLLGDLAKGGIEKRIIPARAGFTSTRRLTITPTWDHPRSRGVYSGGRSSPRPRRGSSPLARGLLYITFIFLGTKWIIPARAGFTREGHGIHLRPGDHPRSRGVYGTACESWVTLKGSSPLARGLHQARLRRPGLRRIIPARAGFTSSRPGSVFSGWDHPRSRGVYHLSNETSSADSGSSPLARGLPLSNFHHTRSPGIIPARAGFTGTFRLSQFQGQDHPRSRGVYAESPAPGASGPGSSPLARGLRPEQADPDRRRRIIPARAGFTH